MEVLFRGTRLVREIARTRRWIDLDLYTGKATEGWAPCQLLQRHGKGTRPTR